MGSEARGMTLRRAGSGDAETVGRIHVESWNVAYRGIMPDDVIARTDLAYRTAFWAERIADPEWPVYLIEEEGQGVAFCQMIPTKDPDDDPTRVGHITSLHVLPDLRGHGYGRALMNHVLEEFWNARRFYEKAGFRLDSGTRRYPRTNVPEVRYRIGLNRG